MNAFTLFLQYQALRAFRKKHDMIAPFRYALLGFQADIKWYFFDKSKLKNLSVINIPTTRQSHKLCLFAHFDAHDTIENYVVYHLSQIKRLGADIVFVSTCPSLAEAELRKIKPLCQQIILRQNYGFDFGGWKTALELRNYDISSYTQLIIANDSVYGPLFDLAAVFSAMEQQKCDFWGITDSFEGKHHLQSYFLVFNQNVLQSDVFIRFWKQLPYYAGKNILIARGELALSQKLSKHFKMGSYCPYETVRTDYLAQHPLHSYDFQRYVIRNANPTLLFWEDLITRHHCPYIKRELLRDNPKGADSVSEWKTVITTQTKFDPTLIQDNLQKNRRLIPMDRSAPRPGSTSA